MVFAHLVHTQLGPLLDFLCSLPGPTGKPALEFVMAEWTSRQHLFYGQYEGKVRWGLLASPLSLAAPGVSAPCPTALPCTLPFSVLLTYVTRRAATLKCPQSSRHGDTMFPHLSAAEPPLSQTSRSRHCGGLFAF